MPAAALLELRLHQDGQEQQQQQTALQSVAGGSGGALSGQQGSGGRGGVGGLGGWRTGHTGMCAAAAATAAAWRAAAVFAVGNAVCGLVISAVTDLAGRVAFVKELRRRGTAAGGQGQQLQDCASCRGGVMEGGMVLKQDTKEWYGAQ